MHPRIALASRLPEPVDPTATAAARLADETGGQLVLVYVAVELSTAQQVRAATGEDAEGLRERMIEEVRELAAEYLERNLPGRPVEVRILEGDVVEAVHDFAVRERVDYLVIGTEGRGKLSRVILGSTSEKLLQQAPCPVLVVPATAPEAGP